MKIALHSSILLLLISCGNPTLFKRDRIAPILGAVQKEICTQGASQGKANLFYHAANQELSFSYNLFMFPYTSLTFSQNKEELKGSKMAIKIEYFDDTGSGVLYEQVFYDKVNFSKAFDANSNPKRIPKFGDRYVMTVVSSIELKGKDQDLVFDQRTDTFEMTVLSDFSRKSSELLGSLEYSSRENQEICGETLNSVLSLGKSPKSGVHLSTEFMTAPLAPYLRALREGKSSDDFELVSTEFLIKNDRGVIVFNSNDTRTTDYTIDYPGHIFKTDLRDFGSYTLSLLIHVKANFGDGAVQSIIREDISFSITAAGDLLDKEGNKLTLDQKNWIDLKTGLFE